MCGRCCGGCWRRCSRRGAADARWLGAAAQLHAPGAASGSAGYLLVQGSCSSGLRSKPQRHAGHVACSQLFVGAVVGGTRAGSGWMGRVLHVLLGRARQQALHNELVVVHLGVVSCCVCVLHVSILKWL